MGWNAAKIETLLNFTTAASLDEDLTVFNTNTSLCFLWSCFLGRTAHSKDSLHHIPVQELGGWSGLSDSPGPGWGTVWLTGCFLAECETQPGDRIQKSVTLPLTKKTPSMTLTTPRQLELIEKSAWMRTHIILHEEKCLRNSSRLQPSSFSKNHQATAQGFFYHIVLACFLSIISKN